MERFLLGFWNYCETGIYGREAVKDWKDCGMNLALSPHFNPQMHEKQIILDILDECAAQNMRVIIDDTRAKLIGDTQTEDDYRTAFKQACEDFGGHLCVYGFYVGDEPASPDAFEKCLKTIKIQKEVAPKLNPFLNLLPYYDDIMKRYETTDKTFEDFTVDFIKASGLAMTSYDCYTQLNPSDAAETGVNNYFENLRRYRDICFRTGTQMWVSNLSVGHFRYRCPNEDDFRWQLNTSVASGANCIMWFFMYMRLLRVNYRVAPIDENWERTETFTWLSRVQRAFMKTYAPLFSRLTFEKSLHIYKAYGGFPLFELHSDELVDRIFCGGFLPGIISFFHDESGVKYAAIVNNSQTESGLFTVYFTPKVKNIYRIAYGGNEVNAECNDVCNEYTIVNGGIRNSAWLSPGQMEVYRLKLCD